MSIFKRHKREVKASEQPDEVYRRAASRSDAEYEHEHAETTESARFNDEPGASREEHERLLDIEEELVQELELPYRVLNIAAGDLGASAAKKYDIEAWFPGQSRYREITSTSNTTDFQSRRLEIRHRREGKLEHLHTLNGTAVTARAMIAILENFQDEDGSVSVPEPLVEFGAPRRLGSERVAAP